MPTCQIKWIDDNGQATPDNNEAVQRVRTVKRVEQFHGRALSFGESAWFFICAEHLNQLSEPGMHIWECAPLES
jgi:hypothetical protein